MNSEVATSIYLESGLGHAFVALTDNCVVSYLLSSEYDPINEFGINPFDPTLQINWNLSSFQISEKDRVLPNLSEALLSGLLPKYEAN